MEDSHYPPSRKLHGRLLDPGFLVVCIRDPSQPHLGSSHEPDNRASLAHRPGLMSTTSSLLANCRNSTGRLESSWPRSAAKSVLAPTSPTVTQHHCPTSNIYLDKHSTPAYHRHVRLPPPFSPLSLLRSRRAILHSHSCPRRRR